VDSIGSAWNDRQAGSTQTLQQTSTSHMLLHFTCTLALLAVLSLYMKPSLVETSIGQALTTKSITHAMHLHTSMENTYSTPICPTVHLGW